MRNNFRSLGVIAFISAVAAHGAYQPDSRNGECKAAWSQQQDNNFNSAGSESFQDYYLRLKRSDCFKEWLVVVYMAADNSLSPYSWRDLWEMEAVGSTVSMDVVVYRDGEEAGADYFYVAQNPRPPDYALRLQKHIQRNKLQGYQPEVQEERFLSAEGRSLIRSPTVRKFAEQNSADLRVAGGFIRWAFKKFPSRRVLLVGWSHGEGFDARLDAKVNGKQGGFAFDEHCRANRSCDERMHVTEMAQGLSALLTEVRHGQPVDILGSDACLNQQLEFAFEWRGVADYVFGSSTIVQKKGFNYRTLLDRIAHNPLQETAVLASRIPEIYASGVNPNNHSRYSSYRDEQATMATWTMSEISRLAWAMDDIATELAAYMDAAGSPTERALRVRFLLDLMGVDAQSEIRLGKDVFKTPIRLGGVSMDLYNFLQVLGAWLRIERDAVDEAAKDADGGVWDKRIGTVNAARALLSRSVLASFVGPKYFEGLVKTSLGVAIWAPNQFEDFGVMLPQLAKSAFYLESLRASGGWARLMQRLSR